jgi:hypothetical protein
MSFDQGRRKWDGEGLTNGLPFKYQLVKRETTTNNPARNDSLSDDSSGMVAMKCECESTTASLPISTHVAGSSVD